ncbi:nitroreductase family deazaflavin-dependent oxidoreductase [Nocardia sp. NPDC048505]|uniref:nitroreductase family deazaflavin-dependent oxidoreductase n=1 Tax=unclassified Nocardia TaxID=2637762 RepID=UPI00340B7907
MDDAKRPEGDDGRAARLRAAAAAEVHRHRGLVRTARHGRILSALMLPMVQVSPPAGYGVLTTVGRRTGRRRRKCLRVVCQGERAYLVQLVPPHLGLTRPGAVTSWVHNIRANPRVRLRVRGGTVTGTAREITDPIEAARARSALCDTVYPIDYIEAALHLRGRPTLAKIVDLHRYWFDTGHPLVIEWAATSRRGE